MFLIATVATIALSMDYNARQGITAGESHVLLLFATSGMMTLAAARDLMIVFLGIEIMSVAVYVLAGLNRRSERSAEGAIKYFLLGAFSTAFLLYGIALVYGATGTTNLATIGDRVRELGLADNAFIVVGVALLLVGFGFKVAAVPFHMWAPDVYEGAPTPINRVHGRSGEGRSFRRIPPRVARGVPRAWRKLAWSSVVAGCGDDDRRQSRCARSEEHQANARLLEHRACRLHPRCDCHRHSCRNVGVHVLSARLHARDVRRVRGNHRSG